MPLGLSGFDPTIAHNPRPFGLRGFVALVFKRAHHATEVGQFAPFNWLIYLDQPYRSGLYRRGDSQLYLSEGTGYWGPPLRIGTRSELTHITLSSEQPEA